MHEISLVSSLFEIINRQIERHGIVTVSAVHLKVGELAGVESMTLTACFEVLAEGTAAAGARLVIDHIPLTGRCNDCSAGFRIVKHEFRCPLCHGDGVEVVGGKELYLDRLEAVCKGDRNEEPAT
jgi:hydrogenase nickel incorporation protein HypA/HybF